MTLDIDKNELLALMKDFYLLTGIKVVLLDTNQNTLAVYPSQNSCFCEIMKTDPATSALCAQSDRKAFQLCQKKQTFIIYHCHAGLIEACAPLKVNNRIVGYFMLGQISDLPSAKLLNRQLWNYVSSLEAVSVPNPDFSSDISRVSHEQIRAAAKLMNACAHYVVSENTVRIRREKFIRQVVEYINEHLKEPLPPEQIARHFHISRTKLYQEFTDCMGKGIAAYILELRIERAKVMLTEHTLSVREISECCGFNDYNYFCRVFKKNTGISAGKYYTVHVDSGYPCN